MKPPREIELVGGPYDGEMVEFKGHAEYLKAVPPKRTFVSPGPLAIAQDYEILVYRLKRYQGGRMVYLLDSGTQL